MEGAVVVAEERHGVRHHPDEVAPTVEVRQRPVTGVIGDGGVGVYISFTVNQIFRLDTLSWCVINCGYSFLN